MNDRDLDRLLARPLTDVADSGFTRTISQKILAAERRNSWIEIGAGLGTVAILAALVPADALQYRLEAAGNTLANSVPLAIGCAVLALMYSAYRLMEENEYR